MIITVDFDGVLYDHLPNWLAKYNRVYEDNFQYDAINCWNWDRLLKPECGTRIYGLRGPDLYEGLEPLPGSQAAVRWLWEQGAELWLVTSERSKKIIEAKQEMVARDFPWFKEFYSTSGPKEKGAIAAASWLHIDDYIGNLRACACPGVLFGVYPYHREIRGKLPERIHRAPTWAEVPAIVESVSNARLSVA